MLNIQKTLLSLTVILLILMPCLSIASGRCVILIHGLARSHYSMATLAKYLQLHGYLVVNQDYPSTKLSIEAIANQEIPLMVNACLKYQPDSIYFVTHSMGGVILRQYLQTHSMPTETKIVMLGPPNHGSPLADIFHNNELFKLITGPAGQELTTHSNALPNQLPFDLPYQVGIIAGNFSLLPITALFFHEANDGKVAISSTKLTTMTDFIILPASHTFMMMNSRVVAQILHFFEKAQFNHQRS